MWLRPGLGQRSPRSQASLCASWAGQYVPKKEEKKKGGTGSVRRGKGGRLRVARELSQPDERGKGRVFKYRDGQHPISSSVLVEMAARQGGQSLRKGGRELPARPTLAGVTLCYWVGGCSSSKGGETLLPATLSLSHAVRGLGRLVGTVPCLVWRPSPAGGPTRARGDAAPWGVGGKKRFLWRTRSAGQGVGVEAGRGGRCPIGIQAGCMHVYGGQAEQGNIPRRAKISEQEPARPQPFQRRQAAPKPRAADGSSNATAALCGRPRAKNEVPCARQRLGEHECRPPNSALPRHATLTVDALVAVGVRRGT
ncbi:hypothetical protein GGTG_05111 [Gaeumannomyces tritici R3-111a-1]|uniref:Uncharacterized protein n=1 Tax=Gaeumannomyces tritici (strain R3-111a-1) TaxID=644352 RepID=J3NV02_GAET3|nr:hypothetical protein GGTG_05111 [Gaeumannomyces tritici R3-111a-1]EJT75174.1 hypothetical protein GGTG_05111 [Gaeumannomyces tritici R3-111a-1]